MQVIDAKNTKETTCPTCGDVMEIIELLNYNGSLICPDCFTRDDYLTGLCGYEPDLDKEGLPRECCVKVG